MFHAEMDWLQISGHKDSFILLSPALLLKNAELGGFEHIAYLNLMKDQMRCFVPNFHGIFGHKDSIGILLNNLLYGFDNQCIMDIKMGSRTFLEDEVFNSETRKDLFEKIMVIDPSILSFAEKQFDAINKLRYMKLHDELSSTSTLGFRIESFKTADHLSTKSHLSHF